MSEAAYFCERSGVRIVAPGVAKSAGGEVEEYVGGDAVPPGAHDPPLHKRKTNRAPTAAPPIETPDPKPTE